MDLRGSKMVPIEALDFYAHLSCTVLPHYTTRQTGRENEGYSIGGLKYIMHRPNSEPVYTLWIPKQSVSSPVEAVSY